MPQNHRRVDDKIANPPMGIIMHIRPADPHGMQADAHMPCPQIRRQIDITQGKFPDTFQNESFHGSVLRRFFLEKAVFSPRPQRRAG